MTRKARRRFRCFCRPRRKAKPRTCCCSPLTIYAPLNRQTIPALEIIQGMAAPDSTVMVMIDDHPPLCLRTDCQGHWAIANPYPLKDGLHCITAEQNQCGCCLRDRVCFVTGTDMTLSIVPIDARMGRSFRTIDVDVEIKGGRGTARVYYLLLPPGSPPPAAHEITGYSNYAALLNGTVARGAFTVSLSPQQELYTWALTGLDNPPYPVGTTGVVDGYRYDVYLHIVTDMSSTEVLSFPRAAMGMPFDRGLGTAEFPFEIRELSIAELQIYPDLLAGNPLNRPGVDENARMLENIERLAVLDDETNGYYGTSDSLLWHYLMTSDINLINYRSAYGGAGWLPLGDVDSAIYGDVEEHHFQGVFDGASLTISNLSITPQATPDYFVGYRGLFGATEFATLRNLKLRSVVIDAVTSYLGETGFGSLVGIARQTCFQNISLADAEISLSMAPANRGIVAGGFVGYMFEDTYVGQISGQNIRIHVDSDLALFLGGFTGHLQKEDRSAVFEDIAITDLEIAGFAMIGGVCGGVLHGVSRMENIALNTIRFDAPGGISGGAIGTLRFYEQSGQAHIAKVDVTDLLINEAGIDPNGLGERVGGIIGEVIKAPSDIDTGFPPELPHPPNRSSASPRRFSASAELLAALPSLAMSRCRLMSGTLRASRHCGGLIGYHFIDPSLSSNGADISLSSAKAEIGAFYDNAGGLVGYLRGGAISQCYAVATADSDSGSTGGLIGYARYVDLHDSYSRGLLSGGSDCGGCIGYSEDSSITHCYHIDNMSSDINAGGIVSRTSTAITRHNLVFASSIVGALATTHRVVGVNSGVLQSNYTLPGVTIPGLPTENANNLDGLQINGGDLIPTMTASGWAIGTIWNAATIAIIGRPTLIDNPEL